MSLKVLLADESSTIKKVFQLALQDYAVEVLAVHSGEDVVPVAKKSKPDIIFIDILLQKKSGYDVACEIKQLPEFANTHIVLMWSSFLTLDQDKFQASLATAHIEKPFEIENLRTIIQELVPKTQTQKLSSFLQMPDVPKEEPTLPEPDKLNLAEQDTPPLSKTSTHEDFEEVNLDIKLKTSSMKSLQDISNDIIDDDDETDPAWISRPLSEHSQTDNFLSPDLDAPDDEMPFDEIKTKIDTVVSEQILESKVKEQKTPLIHLAENDPSMKPSPQMAVEPAPPKSPEPPTLTQEQVEHIIRQEARSLIEEAVWKVVPEIATQMIEREIKRLIDSNKPGAL